MGWDVPDDWGCHYARCSRCGRKYHRSEGGCGCMDGLECQCGKGSWEGDGDEVRCADCETRPYVEGRSHSAEHVARKQHGDDILPGDRYRRTVQFGHYPGGAFTLRVVKRRLEKGPMWIVREVMES